MRQGEIKATAFNEQVDQHYDTLQEGKVSDNAGIGVLS
jgi:hypothetical protein